MHTPGVPRKAVSEILGHSSIAITAEIYGHVSPDVVRHAMETLGDAFGR
jgi:integrase